MINRLLIFTVIYSCGWNIIVSSGSFIINVEPDDLMEIPETLEGLIRTEAMEAANDRPIIGNKNRMCYKSHH